MTYRDDIEALAAREAALAKEVAEKRKQRDLVAAELAEAKEWEAAAHRADGRRTQAWIQIGGVLAVAIVAAAAAGFLMFDHEHRIELHAPHVYSCDEATPDHQRVEAETERNYMFALAAKGLVVRELRGIEVPQVPDGRGPQTAGEVDDAIGRHVETGDIIPFESDGKRYAVYVGPAIAYELRTDTLDFASDGHGGIWHVIRAPHEYFVKALQTTGCEEGCWGTPQPGAAPPQWFHRTLWIIPEGSMFRGDITIDYAAPSLDEQPTQKCGPMG